VLAHLGVDGVVQLLEELSGLGPVVRRQSGDQRGLRQHEERLRRIERKATRKAGNQKPRLDDLD
jgi:hypothetical protein